MSVRFLLDEHVPPAYGQGVLREVPTASIWKIGDPGTPPRGTPDPDLLIWCEVHDHLLVTSNRKTMPAHLKDHLAAQRHSPGIIILNPNQSVGDAIQDLLIIALATPPEEVQDVITYLPL